MVHCDRAQGHVDGVQKSTEEILEGHFRDPVASQVHQPHPKSKNS